MTISSRENKSFFEALKARLTGQLLVPEDAAYEPARRLWNGRVITHPAALVRCANTQDVLHTVSWAHCLI